MDEGRLGVKEKEVEIFLHRRRWANEFEILAEPTADLIVDQLVAKVFGERMNDQPDAGEFQTSRSHLIIKRPVAFDLVFQKAASARVVATLERLLGSNAVRLLVGLPAFDLDETSLKPPPRLPEGVLETLQSEALTAVQEICGRLVHHSSGMSFFADTSVARVIRTMRSFGAHRASLSGCSPS
jgi:hypothetical protein